MKPRYAAALALVWYLLMAPTFRNPQTDSFTIDLNAPLSAWQLASSYYSGADCELAERDLVDTARLYPNVIGFYTLCIASDDPRLMERYSGASASPQTTAPQGKIARRFPLRVDARDQ